MTSMLPRSSVVHVFVLFIIFCDAVVSDQDIAECFCEWGCYRPEPFQVKCCLEICKDAEARATGRDCEEKCPSYKVIAKLKKEIKEQNTTIEYWKLRYNETKKKLDTMQENYDSSNLETRQLKAMLQAKESSRNMLHGLATPLCLFAALIIIVIVCACLYLRVCKRNTGDRDALDSDSYGGYGGQKVDGSHFDPATDSSFLALKTSAIDSGYCPHRSDQPPDYSSGGSDGRVSSRHAHVDKVPVSACHVCSPTTTASLDQYAKAVHGCHQDHAQSHQQQITQRPPLQSLQVQHLRQNVSDNRTIPNNAKFVNQPIMQRLVLRGNHDSGSLSQVRSGAEDAKSTNEVDPHAFRLAHLDFTYEQQQPSRQKNRVKNSNFSTANSLNQGVSDPPNSCT